MTLNAKSWFDKEKKSICTTISPLKKQKILFSSPFILSHSFKCIRKKSGKLRRQTVIKGLREIKLKDSWSKSQLPVHSPSYASPWAEHLLYTFFFTYDTTSLKLCRRWCKLASQCDPCCIMKQNQAVLTFSPLWRLLVGWILAFWYERCWWMAFLLKDRKKLHSLQCTPKTFTILLNAFRKYFINIYCTVKNSTMCLNVSRNPYVCYIFNAEK